MPPKGRILVEHIVPAGALFKEYKAPFIPDWWMVWLPTAVSGVLNVFQKDQVAAWNLTGTGQASFPNGSDTDPSLFFSNTTASPVTVKIYASAGYPPPSFVPPVTVAKPLSLLIQSQTNFEGQIGMGGNTTKQHTHVGRYVLIAFGMIWGIGESMSMTGITVAGIPATKLVEGHIQAGNSDGAYTGFWLGDVDADGVVNIVLSLGGAGTGEYYMQALSFSDGIRMGNTDYATGGYGTISQNVQNTLANSKALSMCFAVGEPLYSPFLVENTIAPVWKAIGAHPNNGNGYYGMHHRIGLGQADFSYSYTGNNVGCGSCSAVEITTT